MQNFQTSRIILFVYSVFVGIAAILLFIGMLLSPSEPANAILLGLSLPRLILAVGFLIAFLLFSLVGIRAITDQAWAERISEQWFGKNRRSRAIAWCGGISFGLGWMGCFLPFYRAGILSIHWERMRPAMAFLLLAGMATLVVILLKQSNFIGKDRQLSKTYVSSLILFFPSLVLVGGMLTSGFGVYAPEDYWYGAGVPILLSQLIVAITGGILFLLAEKKWSSHRFDLIVFLLIFIVTAVLWAREPLQRSFLFIGPYAPNRVLYPFADAALYETASQFALVGQNFLFYNGPFFERAVYASFLTYLHSLVGQDYGQLMAAQAAIFAVFPAIVYLIGKSLNSRAIGFAAAIIATFRGANSIAASNMIDMANPKMMLTDFPTAIGVALIVLLTIEWLKRPRQKWHYVLWIGGIIGISIMLRTNALLFLLLIPLYALIKFSTQWKKWVATSVLLILAVFAITLPWELRNQSLGGKMYGSFVTKFQSVIDLRYRPPAMPNESSLQKDALSFFSLKQSQPLLELYPAREAIQEPSCNSVACFVPNHFLHNILTSVLILPTSPTLDDLRHAVRGDYPYWRPDWDGSFTDVSLLFFVLNIFFIALGITITWKRQRLAKAGLLPLAVFLIYNLSNGFARTSGGRYIVPVDWIITIYFLIGVFRTITLFANGTGRKWTLFSESLEQDFPKQRFTKSDFFRGVVILAVLFGVGAFVPLAERIHVDRYQNLDVSRILAEHEMQITNAGLDLQEINSFLENPNAEISVGRALYPRYYIENEGEVHFYPVVVMGFPRTTFTLIGPKGEQGIVLPGEKPEHFPHAVDTLVLGCREQFYIDALAVIILDDEGSVYTRSPASTLECPLQQPVCDNNHNCY